MNTTLSKVPCYIASTASSCYDQIVRLAYLNQQSDGGSLQLRRGKACLTETGTRGHQARRRHVVAMAGLGRGIEDVRHCSVS